MTTTLADEFTNVARRFGSGHPVQRIEDASLVTGTGNFADDYTQTAQAHLVFLRSPYAHARILSIDVSSALETPGVLAVWTGADLVAAGVKPLVTVPYKQASGRMAPSPARRVLAHESVRFVGEAVVAVLAESRQIGRLAADGIFVDYEDMPAVTDARAAFLADAPQIVGADSHNVISEVRYGDAAKAEQAFTSAAHVVRLDLINQRLAPSPMEPRSGICTYDAADGRITLRLSSQMPTGVRNNLADALGLLQEQVRVVVGDVGGGFGMKTNIYPEDVVLAFAARASGRPVKWAADRTEEFLAAIHGRDVQTIAELALDANGRVLALRTESYANVGAYATTSGVAIQTVIGPWVSTSVYDIPCVDLHIRALLTNTSPTGAYRGAGRPEAIYIIERLMDAAARAMGLDPAELRRRNLVRPEQMPYKNALAQTYDTGHFESMLNQALPLADWAGFDVRLQESARNGKLRGRSVATFLEWTGGNAFTERVTVTVADDGYIEITSATQAMGQGIVTSYAQLAVDVFGVPIERIRIVQGDTDRANGFGSAGSRSLFTGGSAIHAASEKTISDARSLAAEELEAPAADIEYRDGKFKVAGTDLGIGLFELAARQPKRRIFVDLSTTVSGPSWPNACHICEVEVDPETGAVEIVAYASVNDIGRIVNPTIVRGQIEGGAVQGIGQALSEHMVYDAETGQALTASFLDYALQRADGFRAFKTVFDQSVPSLNNPLGVKGVGELGTIGATPAVVNAVVDALARSGLGRKAESINMPLTSGKVWAMLHGKA